jgi:hypothetical protein
MISVLFVAKNSVYKTLTDSSGEPLDCWDEDRDAMKWPGGNPVVAHPPCRLFSKHLRHLSTAPISEKQLAYKSVEWVRKFGGVLEHPAQSLLWKERDLPRPGRSDEYGISIALEQRWWGHKLRKSTWLYICGCNCVPEIPLILGEPEITGRWNHGNNVKPFSHLTPPAFARWLVETAERCQLVKEPK